MKKFSQVCFIAGTTMIIFAQCSGHPSGSASVNRGQFSPCPRSPNCVSSQSDDKQHYVEPLRYQGTMAEARKQLLDVLHSLDRCKVVTIKEDYLHAEFTSAFFRFIDDLECYLDTTLKIIHIRSASRTGYTDFGVNRRRVEHIRKKFLTNARDGRH